MRAAALLAAASAATALQGPVAGSRGWHPESTYAAVSSATPGAPPKVVVPSSRKLQALAQTSSPNVQGRQSFGKAANKPLDAHAEDVGTPVAVAAPEAVSPLITF